MVDFKDNFQKSMYKIWGWGKKTTTFNKTFLRLFEQLSYKIIQTYVVSQYMLVP